MNRSYQWLALLVFLIHPLESLSKTQTKTLWKEKPSAPLETTPHSAPSEAGTASGDYKNDGSVEDLEIHREKQKEAVKQSQDLIKILGTPMGDSSATAAHGTMRAQIHPPSASCQTSKWGSLYCMLSDPKNLKEKPPWLWGLSRQNFMIVFEAMFFIIIAVLRRTFFLRLFPATLKTIFFEGVFLVIQVTMLGVIIPTFAALGRYWP